VEEFGPALLLFAVAGYLTLRHCANRTKFRWAALEWEQNVFESAALGLLLFFVVRLLAVLMPRAVRLPHVGAVLAPIWYSTEAVFRVVRQALPFRFSGSLVAAFMLGIGGGLLSNVRWRAAESVRRAVRNHGGDLRIFLHEMAVRGAPVSLTMKNRKVYVGLVMVPPGLEEPSYVKLLPTLSGYRDEQTLQLTFTTPYEHVYEDLEKRQSANEEISIEIESFVIVLPLENVDSANQFDDDAYTRYFAGASAP
jgi:hypothetical protein